MSDKRTKEASLWEATNMGFNDRQAKDASEDVLAALESIRDARVLLDEAEARLLAIQAKLGK